MHPLLFADRRASPGRSTRDAADRRAARLRRLPELWPIRHGVRDRPPAALHAAAEGAAAQVEHRGVVTAAMVYDALPIIDVFRRVSDDVRLGAMDMRGLPSPFLFVLRRDEPAA